MIGQLCREKADVITAFNQSKIRPLRSKDVDCDMLERFRLRRKDWSIYFMEPTNDSQVSSEIGSPELTDCAYDKPLIFYDIIRYM